MKAQAIMDLHYSQHLKFNQIAILRESSNIIPRQVKGCAEKDLKLHLINCEILLASCFQFPSI